MSRLRNLEIASRLYWRVRRYDTEAATLASVLRKQAIEDARREGFSQDAIVEADEKGKAK